MQNYTLEEIAKMMSNGALSDEQARMLREDARKGAQKLYYKYENQRKKEEKETNRIINLKNHELEGVASGYSLIAGVDEAGRGPLAGPVVAAAVILPLDVEIEGLDDSKKLSPKKRDVLYREINEKALDIGIGIVDVDVIDQINIHQASLKAMHYAILKFQLKPDYILVDAYTIPEIKYPQKAIKYGDRISFSIAAASIIAKVTRDGIMKNLDLEYPQYGFARHKGYGTQLHRKALEEHGSSPVHRHSFTGGKYDVKGQ